MVTLGLAGAWARLRAVDTGYLGVAPEGTDPGALSTLPVAAGSALRALHRLGPLLARRILVTGATGGVGRFAVQLARRGGAYVIASTGAPDLRGDELRALGAHEVVDERLDFAEPVHGVLDVVGGPVLVRAYDKLAEHGTLASVGRSSDERETFLQSAFEGSRGRHNRSVTSFFLAGGQGLGPDLTWLAQQVAAGHLDPQIAWRGGWEDVATAAQALVGRKLHGKAVLDVS